MPGIRSFCDKVVVVTGAGAGIGRATAGAFASEGATVVLADIHEDRAAEAAAQIAGTGTTALACGVDRGRSRADHGD